MKCSKFRTYVTIINCKQHLGIVYRTRHPKCLGVSLSCSKICRERPQAYQQYKSLYLFDTAQNGCSRDLLGFPPSLVTLAVDADYVRLLIYSVDSWYLHAWCLIGSVDSKERTNYITTVMSSV